MNLRARLSERVHIENIREILHYIQDNERLREEIYRLIYDEDSIVSYQALWVCTHFSKPEVEWLSGKQNELIDATLTCPHSGKRRMLLNLLCQQPLADPPRVDLLDFCIERMVSRQEPPRLLRRLPAPSVPMSRLAEELPGIMFRKAGMTE